MHSWMLEPDVVFHIICWFTEVSSRFWDRKLLHCKSHLISEYCTSRATFSETTEKSLCNAFLIIIVLFSLKRLFYTDILLARWYFILDGVNKILAHFWWHRRFPSSISVVSNVLTLFWYCSQWAVATYQRHWFF